MNLSEAGSIASIGSFALAAILALIKVWPEIIRRGGSKIPKAILLLLIMGIISAGFAVYASWYMHPELTSINQGIASHTREKKEFSKEEELRVKKLIQEYLEKQKEFSGEKCALPLLGEKAVIDLPLDKRPTIYLKADEFKALYKASPTATMKILYNQIDWNAYADIAEAVKNGYMNYLKSLFGADKAK